VSVISHGLSLSSDRNYQNIITDNDTSSETIPELKKDSSIQSGKWGVASWVAQSFMALKIKRWSVIIDQRMYQAIMKVKMENINYRNELYIYIYIYIYIKEGRCHECLRKGFIWLHSRNAISRMHFWQVVTLFITWNVEKAGITINRSTLRNNCVHFYCN